MHSTKSFSKSSKEGRGDTSAWTDTPSERAQKAKMKYVLYIYIYIFIFSSNGLRCFSSFQVW